MYLFFKTLFVKYCVNITLFKRECLLLFTVNITLLVFVITLSIKSLISHIFGISKCFWYWKHFELPMFQSATHKCIHKYLFFAKVAKAYHETSKSSALIMGLIMFFFLFLLQFFSLYFIIIREKNDELILFTTSYAC